MRSRLTIALMALFLVAGCTGRKGQELYFPFKDKIWYRFNNLSFNVHIKNAEKPYDIVFFLNHTKEFEFSTFDFNVVMNTPSGEERIREYHLDIKDKTGKFLGEVRGDSITSSISLRKGMVFGQKGTLRIEIENLTPRIRTYGILGAGIRLVPA